MCSFTRATLTVLPSLSSAPTRRRTKWRLAQSGRLLRKEKGATIDSEGVLKIDAKTPPGAKFIVTADIEHGRAQRQVPVVVYTAAAQPLVGLWQQQSRSDCHAQKDAPPSKPIHELEFCAGGWFSVTWTPFETYRDYWGSYTADNATGTISLQIENGNYVPGDFHGAGKFKRKDNNTIELTGIYLGEPRGSAPVKDQKTTRHC